LCTSIDPKDILQEKEEGKSCGEEGYWLIRKLIKKLEITEREILEKESLHLNEKRRKELNENSS